jgi:hypothetical protein
MPPESTQNRVVWYPDINTNIPSRIYEAYATLASLNTTPWYYALTKDTIRSSKYLMDLRKYAYLR